mmetsp:Transcript_80149/g.224977  ORF Transcript_80149/g.224977 Transcript_80149/m.224977 type:complete len:210 (+) Transcript_80149:532-1161(+)
MHLAAAAAALDDRPGVGLLVSANGKPWKALLGLRVRQLRPRGPRRRDAAPDARAALAHGQPRAAREGAARTRPGPRRESGALRGAGGGRGPHARPAALRRRGAGQSRGGAARRAAVVVRELHSRNLRGRGLRHPARVDLHELHLQGALRRVPGAGHGAAAWRHQYRRRHSAAAGPRGRGAAQPGGAALRGASYVQPRRLPAATRPRRRP